MAVEESELDVLVQRAEDLADRARRRPSWTEARAALTEAGVQHALNAQETALDVLDAAMRQRRTVEAAEQSERDDLETVRGEAEWALTDCFEVRANKTYLAIEPDGTPISEANQRALTADEKRAWIARTVDATPAVRSRVAALRKAEEATAQARDEIRLAEARLSATKHAVVARTAILQHFTYAIPKEQ